MQKISIIIPMFNESEHIQRTITSAINAAVTAGLDYQIIAVDNNSTDNSRELAEALGATVVFLPDLKIGGLRNAGAELATGDYLTFLDADIEVPSNWLISCLNQQENFDVIAHDCDTPLQAPWFARAWQKRSMSKTGQNRALEWLATPNLFLTRERFAASGGFNALLSSGEDKEFGLRLHRQGAKQISLAEPIALHWGYEKSWTEWFKKEFWRQSSHLQLFQKKPSLRLLRFPILCIAVTLCTMVAALSMLTGHFSSAGFFLLLSTVPAVVLAARQSNVLSNSTLTLKLSLLHWLRLHIGCAALLHSTFK